MQIGIIYEDKQSGLQIMVVHESTDKLLPSDLTYQGRQLTVSNVQPSGKPVDDIRMGMDPGSRSKSDPIP